MKHVLTIISLIFWIWDVNASSIISGRIDNVNNIESIKISYYKDYFYIEEIKHFVELESNGEFIVELELIKPEIINFTIGKHYLEIYLKPNEKLYIKADYNNLLETIQFKGNSSRDNYFIIADLKQNIQFKANQIQLYYDSRSYSKYLDSLQIQYQAFYHNYNKQGISTEINNYLYNKMKYQLMDNRWMYCLDLNSKKGKMSRRLLHPEYFNYLDTLNLNDQKASQNDYYRTALMRYLFEERDGSSIQELNYITSDSLKIQYSIINNYNFRKKIFKGDVLDIQLSEYIKRNYERIKQDKYFCDSIINDYFLSCRNDKYKNSIKEYIHSKDAIKKGTSAHDLNLIGQNGDTIKLSSFKGKILYIDFWATWCKPCLINMPESKKIMKEFPEVVFIYINLKDEKRNWLNYIKTHNEQHLNHYYLDEVGSNNVQKSYNFSGIPRYIIIDKEFKFYDSNAKSPIYIKEDLHELTHKNE